MFPKLGSTVRRGVCLGVCGVCSVLANLDCNRSAVGFVVGVPVKKKKFSMSGYPDCRVTNHCDSFSRNLHSLVLTKRKKQPWML